MTVTYITRAAVGTEFISPYPPYTHAHGNPHGDPHTHGRVQGCRGDGISIPIPTPYPCPWESPWGSPYPRQSSGLPWGRNFYPHTHPIPMPMGIPMGIPIPTAPVDNWVKLTTTLFGDHYVMEEDWIYTLKSCGQALKQDCYFPRRWQWLNVW